ncbi:hypothetical protein [Morganella morganii]|uniref:hypothetical protein n=1 Tax=Morganella morganii TaxID=582 RepID=UPI00129A0023|nr:hypothetical protein [Morganella morganii]MRE58922.1 hypothetical protein [Morganella morganii]HDU8646169.1 hypothetical protein [Morganella morganii subsp. morganii]
MSDFLSFFKDNSVSITVVITITSVFVTFWFSRKNYKLAKDKLEKDNVAIQAKIEADKKSLRQQMITNNIAPMRQAWINDVREKSAELLADLHLILYSKISRANNNDIIKNQEESVKDLIKKIQYKWSYLSILLPLPTKNNPEGTSQKIITCFNALMELTYLPNDKINKSDINKSLGECTVFLRQLLKEEWEVTKSLKEIE